MQNVVLVNQFDLLIFQLPKNRMKIKVKWNLVFFIVLTCFASTSMACLVCIKIKLIIIKWKKSRVYIIKNKYIIWGNITKSC